MVEDSAVAEGVTGSAAVLASVQTVRSVIPGWQRTLTAVTTEAGNQNPDMQRLGQMLELRDEDAPDAFVQALERSATDAETTLLDAVGIHAQLLCRRLSELGEWWQRALGAAGGAHAQDVLANVSQAQTAAEAAMMHALFIAFIDDVSGGHVGESRSVATYCVGWGVSADAVDVLWAWLLEDPHAFDGRQLPIVFDTTNKVAYRKTDSWPVLIATAATPVWSAASVFAVVALLFELLHGAGMFKWPGDWGWKLLVLVLFVWLGALAHVGAQVLNVKYSDPMKVYDAGSLVDWLSLRWLAIIKMHLPVAVVVASLWGAGNVPTSFQTLGTAILAGYSADSFMSALLSRLGGTGSSATSTAAG
jgi:hypothetical protein